MLNQVSNCGHFCVSVVVFLMTVGCSPGGSGGDTGLDPRIGPGAVADFYRTRIEGTVSVRWKLYRNQCRFEYFVDGVSCNGCTTEWNVDVLWDDLGGNPDECYDSRINFNTVSIRNLSLFLDDSYIAPLKTMGAYDGFDAFGADTNDEEVTGYAGSPPAEYRANFSLRALNAPPTSAEWGVDY